MKTILITGAAQGIGYHAAVTLAAMGHTVFALVRPSSDRSKLDAAQAELKTLHVLVADVTDSASIDTAIASALSISKRMDVVVNNACHVVIGTCETCALAEQMTSMDVNYFGPVRVLQAVLPLMRKQRSGKVINISSIAGYEPFPHLEAYVASKWALEGLSESLAVHLAAWNISVSLIQPGGVKTEAPRGAPFGSRHLEDTDAYAAYCSAAKSQMAGNYDRSMHPDEVVKVITDIIADPTPSLRYPVGNTAIDRAAFRFSDPSGDAYVSIKRELLQKSGLYDLLG